MICQGCDGKFGSNGEPEVEVESYDDSTDSNAGVETKVNIPCGNCGSEFKEGYLSFDVDIAGAHECEKPVEEGEEITFEISDVSAEVSDDFRPKFTERKLKDGTIKRTPVKARFQRHFYDVNLTLSVQCGNCEEAFEVTSEDSLQAGELEAV